MDIDTRSDLTAVGLTDCLACEGSGTVRLLNGGYAFDASCEECGPAFIEGHDDALTQQQDGWDR